MFIYFYTFIIRDKLFLGLLPVGQKEKSVTEEGEKVTEEKYRESHTHINNEEDETASRSWYGSKRADKGESHSIKKERVDKVKGASVLRNPKRRKNMGENLKGGKWLQWEDE